MKEGKKFIKVKLIKSVNKKLKRHKACVRGLGLGKIGHVVEVEDVPAIRGMVDKVKYLLQIEE
jgi:large subunit ribosomal protein L30